MSEVSDLPTDTTDDPIANLDDAPPIVDDIPIDQDVAPPAVDTFDTGDTDLPPALDLADDTTLDDGDDTAVLDATPDNVPPTAIHLTDDGQLVDVTPTQPPAPAGSITFDENNPPDDAHNPIGMPIHPEAGQVGTTGTVDLPGGGDDAPMPPIGDVDTTTAPPGGQGDDAPMPPIGEVDTTTAPPGPQGGIDPDGQNQPPLPGSDADHSGLTPPSVPSGDGIQSPDGNVTGDDHSVVGIGQPTGDGATGTIATGDGDPNVPANNQDGFAGSELVTTGDPNPAITGEQAMSVLTNLSGAMTPGAMGAIIDQVDAAGADGMKVDELVKIIHDNPDVFGQGTGTAAAAAPPTPATTANVNDALNNGRQVMMFVERETTTTTNNTEHTVEPATIRGFDARTSTYHLNTASGTDYDLHSDDLAKILTMAAVADALAADPTTPTAAPAEDGGDGGGLSGLQMVAVGAGVLIPAAAGAAVLVNRKRAGR